MEQLAALRAEWFVRLSDAIEGAQRVAWQLRTTESVSKEARDLYGRLEEARIELDALRGIVSRNQRTDPEWLDRLGWNNPLADPID